jgi:hypothetical protein
MNARVIEHDAKPERVQGAAARRALALTRPVY